MNHPYIPQLTPEQLAVDLAADQERIQAAFAAFDAKWEELHPGFGARVQAQIDAETSAAAINNHDATDQDWFGANPESTQQLVFEPTVQEPLHNRERSIGRSAIKRALGFMARIIGRVPARHVASGNAMATVPQPVGDTFEPEVDAVADNDLDAAPVRALDGVRDVLAARTIIDRLRRIPAARPNGPKHRAEPAANGYDGNTSEAAVSAIVTPGRQTPGSGNVNVNTGNNHWKYYPSVTTGDLWTPEEKALLDGTGGLTPELLEVAATTTPDSLPRRAPGAALASGRSDTPLVLPGEAHGIDFPAIVSPAEASSLRRKFRRTVIW